MGYIFFALALELRQPVHPHVRGVYGDSDIVVAILVRFIPTCVGYIYLVDLVRGGKPVHPHVRGVYAPDARLQRPEYRFIPTCVGYILEKHLKRFDFHQVNAV